MDIGPYHPSLVFPVPEDGSEELKYLAEGPVMNGATLPAWPGFYIRLIDGEWKWNEFMDGYWIATGIFAHEIQDAPWRGAVLQAFLDREQQWQKELLNERYYL